MKLKPSDVIFAALLTIAYAAIACTIIVAAIAEEERSSVQPAEQIGPSSGGMGGDR